MKKLLGALAILGIFNSCSTDSGETNVDMVPPEVNISMDGNSNFNNEDIIYASGAIILNIEATDTSGLQKVVAYINDSKVAEDMSAPYQLIIDISNFTSKSIIPNGKTYVLRIDVIDNFENITSIEKTISLAQKLITINIPQDYYQSEWARHYVFASDLEGNLLDIKRIFPETQEIQLSTYDELPNEFEYMLTFGTYTSGQFGNSTNLITVSNISGLDELNLKASHVIYHLDSNTLPAVGFDPQDIFNGTGGGKLGGGGLMTNNTEFRIHRNQDVVSGQVPSKLYVDLHNLSLHTYSYAIIDWDISQLTEINEDIFTNEGLETLTLTSDYLDGSEEWKGLNLIGFLDEHSYQNNIWTVYGLGLQNSINGYTYLYNNTFHKQIYSLTLGNYNILAHGKPVNHYPKLNWTIDYQYQNNEITFDLSEGDHIVGEISLTDDSNGGYEVDGKKVNYYWEILFDSQKQTSFKLPKIPEEFQSFDFYPFYEQQNLDFNQIKISRFEGISDYQEFLNKIIKDDNSRYLTSPKIESISKSRYGHYMDYLETATFPLSRD